MTAGLRLALALVSALGPLLAGCGSPGSAQSSGWMEVRKGATWEYDVAVSPRDGGPSERMSGTCSVRVLEHSRAARGAPAAVEEATSFDVYGGEGIERPVRLRYGWRRLLAVSADGGVRALGVSRPGDEASVLSAFSAAGPGFTVLPAAPAPGSRGRESVRLSDGSQCMNAFVVQGTEEVRTNAGTYEGLRVRRGWASATPGVGSESVEEAAWYARGVGLVKLVREEEWRDPEGHVVLARRTGMLLKGTNLR